MSKKEEANNKYTNSREVKRKARFTLTEKQRTEIGKRLVSYAKEISANKSALSELKAQEKALKSRIKEAESERDTINANVAGMGAWLSEGEIQHHLTLIEIDDMTRKRFTTKKQEINGFPVEAGLSVQVEVWEPGADAEWVSEEPSDPNLFMEPEEEDEEEVQPIGRKKGGKGTKDDPVVFEVGDKPAQEASEEWEEGNEEDVDEFPFGD